MADCIRIDTEQLEILEAQLGSLAAALEEARRALDRVYVDRACGAEVRVNLSHSRLNTVERRMASGDVSSCLSSISEVLAALSSYSGKMGACVGRAAETFSDAERGFVHRFGGVYAGEEGAFAAAGGALGFGNEPSRWSPQMIGTLHSLIAKGGLVLMDGMALLQDGHFTHYVWPTGLAIHRYIEASFTGFKYSERISLPGGGFFKREDSGGVTTAGFKADHLAVIEQEEFYRSGDESVLPKGESIGLYAVGIKADESISLLHSEGSISGERGSASYEADVLKAELEGGITGGLGVFVPDEHGNPQLCLGVEAKMGASVCAAEISAEGEYELIDNVSVFGEGSVSALEAEASLGAGIGIVGGKTVAYAKAGAEADLVKAEGKVGVDVAGVKGTVGGAVKVGIGASASAGYNDGKFSFSVSAAIGVGAEVSFELDVSELVDNTVGKAVVQGVSKAADWAGKLFGWGN